MPEVPFLEPLAVAKPEGRVVGTETEIPARSQMAWTAGAISAEYVSVLVTQEQDRAREEGEWRRTSSVLDGASLGRAGLDGGLDLVLSGGALALCVRQTAA